MKFSKKTEYGLSALIDMCQQQERGGRMTTRDIAARRRIPERFLEQQITTLRNAGLVHSQRGALGGCSLRAGPTPSPRSTSLRRWKARFLNLLPRTPTWAVRWPSWRRRRSRPWPTCLAP